MFVITEWYRSDQNETKMKFGNNVINIKINIKQMSLTLC